MEVSSGKRRVWPDEERQRIVADATAPGASVAAVALQHGINANLLFKWIRHARQGWLGRRCGSGVTTERAVVSPAPVFVPVEIVAPPAPAPTLLPMPRTKADRPASPAPRRRGLGHQRGAMEIALPNGTRVSLDNDVDPAMLRLYTPTSFGTDLASGKPVEEFEGRSYVRELWLKADVALIKAHRGDRLGNLVFNKAARNFNPLMATAATVTIAQVTAIVEPGAIDPEAVVTPGIFVQGVVAVADPAQEEDLNRANAAYPARAA